MSIIDDDAEAAALVACRECAKGAANVARRKGYEQCQRDVCELLRKRAEILRRRGSEWTGEALEVQRIEHVISGNPDPRLNIEEAGRRERG